MSRILHLPNGSAIHSDIIKCFDAAVENEFNKRPGVGSTDFWNFVESDMYTTLSIFYNSKYIDECFECLADAFDLQQSWDKLNVLRTDFLGLSAIV